MLKMIHNQLTDRLVGGTDREAAESSIPDITSDSASNESIHTAVGNADALDHRPSIDAIVSSDVRSEAADASVDSTGDRQIYALENPTARSDDHQASTDDTSESRMDLTAADSDESTLGDDDVAAGVVEHEARIREIRDWHLSKAQMSWSLETQQRHEDFAAWLDDALKHGTTASS